MWTHGPRLKSHTISSPGAFGSGELKTKALEWSQHYSLIFHTLKGSSKVSDGILPKFKPIQAFMADLVTCKNEEDPLENEGTRVVTMFLPL